MCAMRFRSCPGHYQPSTGLRATCPVCGHQALALGKHGSFYVPSHRREGWRRVFDLARVRTIRVQV